MKDLTSPVQFVSIVNKVNSNNNSFHLVLRDGLIYSAAGSLIACAKFEGDFDCAVDGSKLFSALNQCSEDLVLSDSKKGLVVKSGQFKAVVPILAKANTSREELKDEFYGELDENFIKGLKILNGIIKSSGSQIYEICVKISNNYMVATDGKLLIEYRHGFEFPNEILLSKEFIEAIIRVKKPVKGFGFSESTFTIHFEDNSWLRGDTINGHYPNVSKVFADWEEPCELEARFLELCDQVSDFSDDGSLWVGSGKISSHELSLGVGANIEFSDEKPSVRINYKKIRSFRPWLSHFDIHSNKEKVLFVGPNIQGMLTKYKD